MHRVAILMAVLTSALANAPPVNVTESPNQADMRTETVNHSTMKLIFSPAGHNVIRLSTSKPRRQKGKTDSLMLNHIFDSYATSSKHFHDKFRAPTFEGNLDSEDTILDADSGATVYFDCRVSSVRDKTVSWIRVSENENLELLTLNLDTHTADSRYRVDLAGDNWRLELADAKAQDSGIYCCHVSTHPPMLRRVKLTVHPPEIKTSKEAFLESGETLSLKCSVMHLYPGPHTPMMHWFRGNTTEPLDELRGGVLIETDHLTLTSNLQVAKLRVEDAGNYTCVLATPLLMRATTRVHVLQGSSLAELQSGVKTTPILNSLIIAITLLVFLQEYAQQLDIR